LSATTTIFGSDAAPLMAKPGNHLPELAKAPTGIGGLDEVTGGGLPKGRATLVCGPAGCGKTLLGMEFLVRGIAHYGEAGVFLAFEESTADLAANVASLGFDLPQYQHDGMLVLDHIEVAPIDMDEAGEWDLEALFIRLGSAIDQVNAKRVVLDTLENLFGAFSDAATVRSELRRLFGWLKERGVTAVVTGERGDGSLTRHGIEEYVSDCVIVLDHRVTEQTSTRRLRVLKYRGSLHGTNEYPFFIGDTGLSVLPITSLGLQHAVSEQRISTGIARLDGMLGGEGVYRGSSVLVSGTAGTGKSTIAAHAPGASVRFMSRSKSLPPRSFATWPPSGSISNAGSTTGCCNFTAYGQACWAWRPTFSSCRSWSPTSTRSWWCLIRSPTSWAKAGTPRWPPC
jgi:circadian clock protein KaiC